MTQWFTVNQVRMSLTSSKPIHEYLIIGIDLLKTCFGVIGVGSAEVGRSEVTVRRSA